MTKGTSSFGKRRNKTHYAEDVEDPPTTSKNRNAVSVDILRLSYAHTTSQKAKRNKTTCTGRMRHLKIVRRRFRNGFKEGKPTPKKAVASS